MSRNITVDKFYKVEKKNCKKSTSVDGQLNELTSMKTSFDCSSTKNYNKKSIDFTEIDANQKKFSSRISNNKKCFIPVKNKTIVDSNFERDHSLGSIYKTNDCRNRKCSPSALNVDIRYISPLNKNKNITYETILKDVFDNIDNFNKNTKKLNNISDLYSNLLGIFDKLRSKECKLGRASDRIDFFDKIWKEFVTATIDHYVNLEKEEKSIRNKFNEQVEKYVNLHSSLENERLKLSNLESFYKAEIEAFKKILSEKDKKIKESSSELNKVLAIKEKCESNEIYLYSQKQLLRDNKVLTNENKQLGESIIKLEKDLENLKIKEVKMMKILFTLSRKGVAINDIVDNELTTEYKKDKKSSDNTSVDIERDRSENFSINDSMYTPIYTEPAKVVKKPEKVPFLDLYNINNSILNFNSEETINKEKLNNCSDVKPISIPTDPNLSEIKDNSFSEKYFTQNLSSPKIKESSYYPASYLNAMEKELIKTYKSINKDKNLISNKSTMNNTEINFDIKSYSKKNSFNDSIKTGIVEIKDSTNVSEQEFDKLSFNLNSSSHKNQNQNHNPNLKDKLLSSKKANISSLFNCNNYNRNNSKIKLKSNHDELYKHSQFHSTNANDEKVVIDKKLTSSHDFKSDLLGKKVESIKDAKNKK